MNFQSNNGFVKEFLNKRLFNDIRYVFDLHI